MGSTIRPEGTTIRKLGGHQLEKEEHHPVIGKHHQDHEDKKYGITIPTTCIHHGGKIYSIATTVGIAPHTIIKTVPAKKKVSKITQHEQIKL